MSPVALAQKGDLIADIANLDVRHETTHYAIAGTSSDAKLLDYGRCLEYIYLEYARGFAQLTEADANDKRADAEANAKKNDKSLQAELMSGTVKGRFPVIIFSKPAEYDQFAAKYLPERLEHTRGVYLHSLKLLLIRDDSDSSQTYEVLFHEAFHQFAHRYVPYLPTWANEGLATYYGHARPTSTGLRFDKPAAWHFRNVQEAKTAKALIPLPELMAMDQAEFYDDEQVANLELTNRQLCYSQAYTLVSFMLSEPAGMSRLRDYLKDLAGAQSRAAEKSITQRHFDSKTLEAMSPLWLTFCQKH
jgi:hypothetical protein